MSEATVLERLFEVIRLRSETRPDGSYVVTLLDGGVDAIGAKVREEAEELIEAAGGGDAKHAAHEAADLLFHTWVLLAHAGVEPDAVFAELERRFGVGGHAEKAARAQGGGEC